MIVTETAVWTTLAIGMTAARTTDDLRHPATDVTSPGTLPFVDMIPRHQRGHSRTVVTNEPLSLARHRATWVKNVQSYALPLTHQHLLPWRIAALECHRLQMTDVQCCLHPMQSEGPVTTVVHLCLQIVRPGLKNVGHSRQIDWTNADLHLLQSWPDQRSVALHLLRYWTDLRTAVGPHLLLGMIDLADPHH